MGATATFNFIIFIRKFFTDQLYNLIEGIAGNLRTWTKLFNIQKIWHCDTNVISSHIMKLFDSYIFTTCIKLISMKIINENENSYRSTIFCFLYQKRLMEVIYLHWVLIVDENSVSRRTTATASFVVYQR